MDTTMFSGAEALDLLRRAAILIAAIVVATLIDRLVTRMLRRVLNPAKVPNASVIVHIARVFIWAFVILAVLDPVFGVTPTAFLAALGVTSLAISLGMQDTISNFIGGLELMVTNVINIGDVIEVNGFRGEVTNITWRSTTLHTIDGDDKIIPNAALNETAITLLSPEHSLRFEVPLVIAHDADLDKVAEEIMAAAQEALGDKMDEKYKPLVCFVGADAYGTQCQVCLHLKLENNSSLYCKDALMRKIGNAEWIARAY